MNEQEYQQVRAAIRMLVRAREDFQSMRKRMDNRIGRKADGDAQENITERVFTTDDAMMFGEVSDEARKQEAAIEKKLKAVLKRMPVYAHLTSIKGVGTIAAGHICGAFDIYRASTVSKMWQYAGLNPGLVRGKKRIEKGDEYEIHITDTMIRGDRLTEGFVAPFNKQLRTALVGVMADGFIKAQNDYCMRFYYPYKARLEQSARLVKHGKDELPWNDASKGHRDRAAKRYMVKMFLAELYPVWRGLHGLEVRKPYSEEYLGRAHHAA